MALPSRFHVELTELLNQHCRFADQRHLELLAQMVTGLLVTETVSLDDWKAVLMLRRCQVASWQRRCQRWFGNARIDVEQLYGPLVLWVLEQQQQQLGPTPEPALPLWLEPLVLWNRHRVVMLSVMRDGARIPLVWRTTLAPSSSAATATANATAAPDVVMALLEQADQLLAGHSAITLQLDGDWAGLEALPGWLEAHGRWQLLRNSPANSAPDLFRTGEEPGLFQLTGRGMREPDTVDRLLLVVAVTVLVWHGRLPACRSESEKSA